MVFVRLKNGRTGVLGEVREIHAWIGGYNFGKGHYFDMPENFPPAKNEILLI